MDCNINNDILSDCIYAPGGINQIFILDIRYFNHYVFKDDSLFDSFYVDRIKINQTGYIEIDTTDQTAYTETNDSGIFKQQLKIVVRVLRSSKTRDLMIANKHKYLVIFSTYTGRLFSFGSDGGATVSFSQSTSSLGDSDIYTLSIDKSSIYPLFEIDNEAMKVYLLGTEDRSKYITSENLENLFEIDGYEHK